MAISGVNTFNLTRNQIIEMALERIGVKTLNRPLTNAEMLQGARFLNAMIKSWKAKGINLWKSEQGYLFTQTAQKAYKLDGATASATQEFSYSLVETDAILGATTIEVADASQFSVGWYVVLVQDDNTNHFTTITNIAGNIITLANATTAAVSAENYFYAFETKIKRPEGVSSFQAFITPTQSVPGVIDSNNSYFNIPNQEITGIPNQVYYDKQLTFGTIYVWPTPQVNTYFLRFTMQTMYDDFTTANDTPDFPPEWLKALYLGLAYDMAGVYGKTPDDNLKMDAMLALEEVEGYDREDASFRITPASTQNIYTYY